MCQSWCDVNELRLKCRRFYEQIRHLNQVLQAARMALYRRRWVRALLPTGNIVPYAAVMLITDCAVRTSASYTVLSSGLLSAP